MQTSEPRGPRPSPTRPDGALAAAVVLGTLLLVAGVTTQRVGHYEARTTRAEVAHRAGEAADLVSARLLDDRALLEGALAFLTAEGLDDQRGFDAYLAALRLEARHPGAEGVGACRLGPSAAALSPLGWAGLPCAEEHRAGPGASPSEGWAEQALLGADGRLEAHGDTAAEPGRVHLSGRRPLARAPVLRAEEALYLHVPLLEAAPPGPLALPPRVLAWAYLPERLEALEALAQALAGPGLSVRLEDAAAPAPAGAARFEALEALQVGEGRWALRVRSTPAFEAGWAAASRQPLAGWGGAVLALLVAALTLALGRGRDDALAEAQRLESDLKAADQELGMRDEALARVAAQLDGCNATADRLLTVVHTLPHPTAPEWAAPAAGAQPAPAPAPRP